MNSLIFVAVLLVIGTVLGHPTKYPEAKKSYLQGELASPPPFRSYHVHFMFQYHNNDSCTGVNNALALRTKFIKDFNIDDVPCAGDFDQGRLCMFPVAYQPFGPFVAPEWAAFVPLEDYARVGPWVMQNRGNFDAFVHPNSGFEREDHHDWSFWYAKQDFSEFRVKVFRSEPISGEFNTEIPSACKLIGNYRAGTPWKLDLSDPEFSEQLRKNLTNCDCP